MSKRAPCNTCREPLPRARRAGQCRACRALVNSLDALHLAWGDQKISRPIEHLIRAEWYAAMVARGMRIFE